jgi:MFS family permease
MQAPPQLAATLKPRTLSSTWLMGAVGFAVFLGAMDQTVVVTLLEPILTGVNVPLDQFYRSAWVINGYILGYVVAMPLIGRVADVYGHSRIFMLSLALFVVGSLWVSVAGSLNELIVARAVQAVGGGGLVPVSMAMVAGHLPPERRALGLGFLGAAAEGGGLFGPLWGGSWVQILGWRGHFWINVPLALPVIFIVLNTTGAGWLTQSLGAHVRRFALGITLMFAVVVVAVVESAWGGGQVHAFFASSHLWVVLPLSLPLVAAVLAMTRKEEAPTTPVDYVGGILLGGALTCLAVALTDDPVAGRPVAVNAGLYVLAAGFGAAFLWRERLTRAPMLMLSLFRSLPFSAGNLTHLLMGGTLIVAMVDIPVFTIIVKGGSYFEGGLNLMRLTVMLPVGAVLGGYLATWLGYQRTTALGMLVAAAGFFMMSFWSADIADPAFSLNLLLTGLGFGLVIAPISAAVINAVADTQRATASALLVVMRLVGMLIGVALLTSRGLGSFYQQAGTIPLDSPEFRKMVTGLEVSTFSDTFVAAAVVCLIAVVPALLIGRGAVRRFRWTEIWRAPH